MTRARHAEILAASMRRPLTVGEAAELLAAVEQSFGAVDAESDACIDIVNDWCESGIADAIRARKASR